MKQTTKQIFGYAAFGAATIATFAGLEYAQQQMGFGKPETEQREKPRFYDDPILLNPAFD